jgi:hypothetical protein
MKPTNGGVTVTDSTLTGYAWAQNTGWISFNTTQSGVTNNGGTLGGFAWSQGEGWLSFTGVTIDSNGKFHGTATGNNSTLTFDCTNCDVRTDWRPASSGGSSGGGGGGIIWPNTSPTTTPETIPPTATYPTYPPSTTNPPAYGSGNGATSSLNQFPQYQPYGTSTNTKSASETGTTSAQKHEASPQLPFPIWYVPIGLLILILLFFGLRFFRIF